MREPSGLKHGFPSAVGTLAKTLDITTVAINGHPLVRSRLSGRPAAGAAAGGKLGADQPALRENFLGQVLVGGLVDIDGGFGEGHEDGLALEAELARDDGEGRCRASACPVR